MLPWWLMERWLLTSEALATVDWWAWIPQRARCRRIGGLQSRAAHDPAAYERPRHKQAPQQASSLESTMAMRQLSEMFSKQGEIKLHSEQPTRNEEKSDPERARQDQKVCNPMWLKR